MQQFEETTDVSYADRVASSFEITVSRPGTIVVSGACPRCGHPMEFLITTQIVKSARGLTADPAAAGDPASAADPDLAAEAEDESMLCTCTAEHPHRPDGYQGCGAYWNVKVLP